MFTIAFYSQMLYTSKSYCLTEGMSKSSMPQKKIPQELPFFFFFFKLKDRLISEFLFLYADVTPLGKRCRVTCFCKFQLQSISFLKERKHLLCTYYITNTFQVNLLGSIFIRIISKTNTVNHSRQPFSQGLVGKLTVSICSGINSLRKEK